MKIDRNKLKKSTTEVPADCRPLIERLKSATEDNLLSELNSVKSWSYGKCELYHWADVLDIFDGVLEKTCKKQNENSWTLACDLPENTELKRLLLQVLHFTALLIEHSFSRHLYNSMEHLTSLLASCDMTVVLEVLNLLFVFSKRSNFITRLSSEKKQGLIVRLTHLAESWGGKDNGFGLAECCSDLPVAKFPSSATTLHFEFYVENTEDKALKKGPSNTIASIHMENLDKSTQLPTEVMEELSERYKIPEDKQTLLYTHIRLAHLFSKYESRIQCVQARLQSIAILVYSNAIQENMNALLYPGFIEELVDIVELPDEKIVDIKGAALRTLTSIIHLERNGKINNIIDATGAASYHGFLPVLVRSCIQRMTEIESKPFPQSYATALFSFLYHLASYDNGAEALVSCGMMESLLKVINWYGQGQDHITFSTRAVRVVDLITNLDMAAFQAQGGLTAFINRLEHEIGLCRKEQPFEIRPVRMDSSMDYQPESPPLAMETDPVSTTEDAGKGEGSQQETAEGSKEEPEPSTSSQKPLPDYSAAKTGRLCFPQRAALLKSMLNFLKKAIPDPSFSESMRHLMDGSLPKSLKHVISNAEYYGPSLFLLATDVVTVYVFQEPSLLSSLQDNGLTDVVLHALLIKDVPATREVLASLPNVFSALCLNARGLDSFVQCRPFDRLFKVLLSPDYLPAMRRRRSADPFGDTASNLGNAMDELMRHQPSLRTDATKAIIKLLEEVCIMGKDKRYVSQKPQPKAEQMILNIRSPQPHAGASSDEEEEEDDMGNGTQDTADTQEAETKQTLHAETAQALPSDGSSDKESIPLMDYVLNVMKFVDAILSNNSTDDHCREFVSQKGLQPLMGILGLPNLPIEFPASPACQAVASVCKAILTLSREPSVLKEGLVHLDEVLKHLEPLHQPLEAPGGSVLLRELANAAQNPDATLSPTATPLLHALSSAHAYIMMFVHVCRIGQTHIRTISVSNWGSDLGLQVLEGLGKLYTSLVWESTVLLALCSEDILPPGCDFGRADMEKLLPKDFKVEKEGKEEETSLTRASGEMGSNGVSHAMESLSTSDHQPMNIDTEQPSTSSDKEGKKSKLSPALQAQVKQMKPLLTVSSRLGRALAELFGLLVKLSVGSRVRQRGSQILPPAPILPIPAAQSVAKALTKLLTDGLQWEPPPCSPVPKLRLTFLVCSVGFTSPMLFDDKKQPYHLMLQKFLGSGGQDALFQAFSWALSVDGKVPLTEGLEDPQLPDGTGEFLDSWLMLIEKMVNPKTVLETPHFMMDKPTQPGFTPFNPVQYLICTQKAAFNAVMNLWNKKPLKLYGSRMSESILAILCHIIKGEGVIREQLASQQPGETGPAPSTSGTAAAGASTSGAASGAGTATNAAPAGAAASGRPAINNSHVQQLMEMGFSLTRCIEALRHTQSLEQATDYLLQGNDFAAPGGQGLAGLDLDLSEDAQMMQAIAMSLGENVVMTTDQGQEGKKEEKKELEEKEKQNSEEPLDKSVLDSFTEKLFPGCLKLLDTLPETVYRVCELLTVVTQRNGVEWQNMVLTSLVKEVQSLASSILATDPADMSGPAAQEAAARFAVRIHLFSLLFEETMMPCAEALEMSNLTDLLVQVMSAGKDYLMAVKLAATPKWLAPLLLLLDLYEKVSVISQRKADAEKSLANCHTWKWFDDQSGRWCKYNTGNNKTIDDAYRAGETCVRFTAGRRRYTVHFSSMVQVNEETSNRRPIMLTFPPEETAPPHKKEQKEDNNSQSATTSSVPPAVDAEMASPANTEKPKPAVIISGLNSSQVSEVIRSVVSMISIPVEAETLHAALRLILRLTREHKYALQFAELGGPKLLLSLTQASAFQGFLSLTMLIFRHILEEPVSLKYCMEKVIKSVCSGSGSSVTGVSQRSVGAKEMHYVLRVLGPAACRNPELFSELAKEIMRIALPPPSKRDEDETRLTGPNAPQIIKCCPTKQMTVTSVQSPLKDMVESLLNALVVKYAGKQEEGAAIGGEANDRRSWAEAIAEAFNEMSGRPGGAVELQTTEDETPVVPGEGVAEAGSSKTQSKEADLKSAEEAKKQRPLLPKSSILRLISEIIKSYCSCTQLITQHMYQAGQTELVTEDCSVLAFVLDQLLHANTNAGDKDCPALSRVFVASIASCNHSPDAQMSLVNEVKAALQRALALPESADKHSRVQSLTGIISTIIESCPSPGQVMNQVFKGQQSVMNNIVKNLLKRGLVTDLARIPYHLDLSSPYMANTINAALKPLETLSRSVNQPPQGVTVKKTKAETETAEAVENNVTIPNTEGATTATGDSSTRDGGDVSIEDVTNSTESHNNLEETHQDSAIEPARESCELDRVIDNLLHRGQSDDPETEVVGEIIMETDTSQIPSGDDPAGVIVDVELEEGELDDHHDSQMISQLISEGEDDDLDHTRNVGDDLRDDDDTADSGSDADDDDDNDDQDDDQDDDDDDDNDDDDEGSDMEAENDDYQDVETSLGRPFDNAFVIHADDMFPPGGGNQHVVFNALDSNQVRTYQMPVSLLDNDANGNESAVPNVPPAPSNVSAMHPLLVRQNESQNVMGITRVQRGRQRGTCRFNPNTQMLHVNFPRQPNPPVILQRLLGPTTAADVLQLTNSLSTQAGPSHTRVVLSNSDLRIISRPEEDILEDLWDNYTETSPSMGMGSALSTVPSTLTRWSEEAKVLDGDSMHDCMAALKPEIVELLEKQRDEEIAERREKRKKAAEEEAAKKEQDQKEKNKAENKEQLMEVSPPLATTVGQDLSTNVVTDPQVLASIPLPAATTSVDTPVGVTARPGAAASQLISDILVSVVDQTAEPGVPVQAQESQFQDMPLCPPFNPLPVSDPTPPPPPPPSRLQAFSDITTPSTNPQLIDPIFMEPMIMNPSLNPLEPEGIPVPTLPVSITSSAQPPPAPATMISTPAPSNPLQMVSPFEGLDLSQIMTPAPQYQAPAPGTMPPVLFNNVPPAANYTPANQPIPFSTPMAPRQERTNTQQRLMEDYFQPIFEEVFGLQPQRTGLSSLLSEPVDLQMDQSATPNPQGALPTPTTEPSSSSAAVRTGTESGLITPEEVSNITSSDAATVHSSDSGSPQEIPAGTGTLLANLPSVTEGGTPVTTSATSISETPTTSSATTNATPGSSSSTPSDPNVPEGLDPSFLAALPENIRQEVIADHLRLQRIQQRTREQQNSETPGGMEVNPEFLAALPPAIQEEVLAQQRLEQERLQAQTSAQANPEAPVDPASFLATLPSTLRQSVLSDMDDSMVAVLPADLAAEAQSLRRDLEERHRRMMQERLFTQAGSGSLSSILRHAGTLRYTLGQGPRSGQLRTFGGRLGDKTPDFGSFVKLRGRYLLDHEALTCLLVLLFVDEPKLNTGRLHRVMRNLCYHGPTRSWVIRSMLSILNRTGECRLEDDKTKTPEKGKAKKSQLQPMQVDTQNSPSTSKFETRNQGSWLSISLEAALGCRANVFQISRQVGKKHSSAGNAQVTIHPQAAPVVCRHVLDALISLAKMFPQQFLPSKAKEVQNCDSEKEKEEDKKTSSVSVSSSGSTSPRGKNVERQDSKPDTRETDFWELLLKLDAMCSSKKGKGIQKPHSHVNSESEAAFRDYDSSPLGQLMAMLSHPVIKRSQLLTDRLLRLLGLVSTGLSDNQQTAATNTRINNPPRGIVILNNDSSAPRGSSVSVRPNTTNTGTNTQTVVPPEGTSVDPPPAIEEKPADKQKEELKKMPEKDTVIMEHQLSTAVQVLTSKACSEEGLEDATNLLLQLSWANNVTREAILQLLLDGARELGLTVCQNIRSLLDDLQKLNISITTDSEHDDSKEMETASTSQNVKGVLTDRFSGGSVVVTAPKKMKGGRELQLASMSLLTSKASSQHFFLRILKVIIQLRDAARSVNKTGKKKPDARDLQQIGEAMALLEADAEAIMQFVSRRHRALANNDDSNSPDLPDTPPVHAAVGQTQGQSSIEGQGQNSVQGQGQSSSQGQSEGAADNQQETPMETDKPGPSTEEDKTPAVEDVQLPRLSEQIDLEDLWQALGECLTELSKTPDHHAVLILQPAVEAFFIVHAGEKDSKKQENKPQKREDQLSHLNIDLAPTSPQPSQSSDAPPLSRENSIQASLSASNLSPDAQKFLKFAETHRTVLNQILRQSTTPLSDGPFSVLVDHTRILDFDVKRRYFRHELERLDEGIRREDLAVHVRREHVFEDSFRELFRRSPDEWKHRFYIVFEGEDGQDAGGLLREWYIIIAREIFNPMYALFCTSPGDRVTYTINQSSHCNSNHLSYFKFVGRIIAKAIYDNKLLECYFTRSFYKHIMGSTVKYTDMESEDYSFYKGLVFLLEHNVKDLGYDLTFSTEIQEFGVSQVRDLKPDGRNIVVTEENKYEYMKLVCQMKMTGAIRQQLTAFLEGFYDIVPKKLISIFNEQELELLISGLPTIDIDDLKTNTEYHKYQPTSLQVLWFWRALRSFDQADRARFLQFVTGTSKVPLQGFAHLEGMNGTQKFQIHRDDRSTDRLPAAHTCFNQLDLPAYETYDKLRHMLLLAVNECSEGFGLA